MPQLNNFSRDTVPLKLNDCKLSFLNVRTLALTCGIVRSLGGEVCPAPLVEVAARAHRQQLRVQGRNHREPAQPINHQFWCFNGFSSQFGYGSRGQNVRESRLKL